MGMLKGYKTYIAAGLAVAAAIVGFLVGDMDAQQVVDQSWKVLAPLAVAFLRAGVASDAKK